ncbi:MAG TPA: phosphoribosylglycinamide formyltransferase [Candidatus Nitrosocosmicus sp.]
MISGKGSNMDAILHAVDNQEIDNINKKLIISNNPDSAGLDIAKNTYGVPIEVILKKNLSKAEFDAKLMDVLRSYEFEPSNSIICLAGFMQILGPHIVDLYKYRILNIHPSLLPSFKGLHAQKQALDAGVKVSGCTVHFVDSTIDTGPIILQKCVKVMEDDDETRLANRILIEEHKIYKLAINLLINNKIKINNNKVFIDSLK